MPAVFVLRGCILFVALQREKRNGRDAMVFFKIGERTGTDRYINGPYRFTFTQNGLIAVVAAIALAVAAHLIAWF